VLAATSAFASGSLTLTTVAPPPLTIALLRLTPYAAADAELLTEAINRAVLTEDVATALDLIDTNGADVDLHPSSTDLVLTP
jgi:hypothetical protein